MDDQFYTVAEAVETLKVSADKVTRMFEDEPGMLGHVIAMGSKIRPFAAQASLSVASC
jgi:hypothetical protein